MDTGATIIILGIIGVIILPFLIINIVKRRKDTLMRKYFSNLVHKENIKLSHKEFWDHRYAIGIDNESKKVVYVKKVKEEVEGTIIDLTEVEKCRIVAVNKTHSNQNGKNPLNDRLDLVFTFRNSGTPEKILEFYENPEFMPSNDERNHIENWNQIISSALKQSN